MAPLKSAVLAVLVAAATPTISAAQVYVYDTPPPQVIAAGANWLVGGEPIFYQGDFYVPSGPDVFFEGGVMARTGVYRGIPLYEDRTIEPHSLVYVPIGRNRMRPYELIRWRGLEGTSGSRASYHRLPLIRPYETRVRQQFDCPVPSDTAPSTAQAPPQPIAIYSIPPPAGNRGMWVEFSGSRWYSAGPAVRFSTDRFTPVGNYRGFAVYRRNNGSQDEIYVTVTPDGPVAPYRR